MKKKPVNGMKDILPDEMAVRDYVISLIKSTYASFGFSGMETPAMESIENLQSKQGGENEKLIFKIMKRGEKLRIDEAQTENDLADAGLRYDLTVPLSRYYANHMAELPSPFKALQIGSVWRADRPQRGRYRQFTQCDIDILGEDTYLAEIELILATTTVISRLGFRGFTIRINDRRILKAMAASCGFPEEDYDRIFIILDKMDKIGQDGVRGELLENGYAPEQVEKYLSMFNGDPADSARLLVLKEQLGDALADNSAEELKKIIDTVDAVKEGNFQIRFDPTLVRGMSYYTGPIFEISMDELGSSVGGGGRYDRMVERFAGTPVSACGFSIGFERIILLLMERGFTVPDAAEKTAVLVDKKADTDKLVEIFKSAAEARREGRAVTVSSMKKNRRFQKEQLAAQGFDKIEDVY
ncbi:MAG: histidine--tRNA ligase [Lachnospiraceae bacterium]|nr:histidine--tRNA ligase [Lachnospiraceae bacterium]